jgi:anthranilate phosphoribosyltransferase
VGAVPLKKKIFNLLGPLSNPAGVKRQVVGVYDRRLVEPIAEVLLNLGSVHALVVHGHDGLDELTTTGATTVAELNDRDITLYDVVPEDAGLLRASLADLKGGDADVNARALREVLAGKPGPYRDIVLLNTAAALIVGGKAASLSEGVERAARAIDSGAASRALERLIAITNSPE